MPHWKWKTFLDIASIRVRKRDVNLTDAVSAPTSNSSEIINVIAGTEHDSLLIDGKINGHRATFLVDTGSTHDFNSESFVQRHRIQTNQSSDNLHVALADGATSDRPLRQTGNLKLNFGGHSETQVLTIFPLHRCDAILGKPWLTRHNPVIDFRTHEIKIPTATLSEPVLATARPPPDPGVPPRHLISAESMLIYRQVKQAGSSDEEAEA